MDRPGYPAVATGYPQNYFYSQQQQQQNQQQGAVEYAKAAGNPYNPYIITQETSHRRGHSPDCEHCERKRKTGIANALAAIFIVCWCCTWPCHGPCCCGF